MPARGQDLTGNKYGMLTVLCPVRKIVGNGHPQTYWRCSCSCGNGKEVVVVKFWLISADNPNCGCCRSQHGMSQSSEYKSWGAMKYRCTNPKCWDWDHYGGRGIKVCQRWLNSFEDFYKDMGPKPDSSYSIDRIDNDGDYYPENCRWASPKQNNNNRSSTVTITYKGETKVLSDWSKITGIDMKTITTRLRKGWSVADALETPTKKRGW